MRLLTPAFAISAFAVFAGTAHAESTMSSGDLIKEMHPDAQNSTDLQTGRSAAGGDGPSLNNAPREDAAGSDMSGEQYLQQAPERPVQ